MTDFNCEVTLERLARAVEATQAICALPAIATQEWCDLAAEALAIITPNALVGVAIAQIDSEGGLNNVEATGAAGPDAAADALQILRNRFSTSKSLGWSLGDPTKWRSAQTARIEQTPVGFVWPSSNGGRVWAGVGADDVMVGVSSFNQNNPNRVIVAEIGAPAANGPFTDEDAVLFRTLLAPVAAKTRVAFGDEPINASRMLTQREQEILEHLALGKSVREIAEQLSRSPHTVHDHVKALHRKLRASSRGALIARALGHNVNTRENGAKATAPAALRTPAARFG